MLWFYVTAMILVGAGELVALFTKRTEPERLAERREAILADIDLKKAVGAVTDKVEAVVPAPDQPPAARSRRRRAIRNNQ